MALVTPSITYFPDPARGRPVFNGSVFVGIPDLDPEIEANRIPVTLRLEDGSTVPVGTSEQPLLTGPGGVILYEGSYAVLVADQDFSLKVLNSVGTQVYYIPNNEDIFDASQIGVTIEGVNTNLENYLDNRQVADYDEFRALSSTGASQGIIDGTIIAVTDDYINGLFKVKTGTVTDNNGTLLVFNDNPNRYGERIFEGQLFGEWFGCRPDFESGTPTDNTPPFQAMANYAQTLDFTIGLGPGRFLFNSTVDLSSPGGGDEGFRNMAVIMNHETRIYGADNTTNIFNVSGQRRFDWSGGWFKRAGACFIATGDVPTAYCTFDSIIFDGEAPGAIGRCFQADTSIGTVWNDCHFGTDGNPDQITAGVELTGISSEQTNINTFNSCKFINNVDAVLMPDSNFARLLTAFNDCWFESIRGYALDIGQNSRNVLINKCYFEACGVDGGKTPIRIRNALVEFISNEFVALQNNNDAFIECLEGATIETTGLNDFGSAGGRVFANYTQTITGYQDLSNVRIIDNSATGSSHEDLLFNTLTPNEARQYIQYKLLSISSTLTDTQPYDVLVGNIRWKGFASFVSETVQLVAQDTLYTMATINIPNPGHGLTITANIGQTIQGVGHAGRFAEFSAYWNGAAWVVVEQRAYDTVAGFEFGFVSVDANNLEIQLRRTLGAGTNTPARIKVTVQQAADNIDGNEISIS